MPSGQKRLDHFHIKRYYNEIYNPANRTVRTNYENQLGFFLSPFTDATLSFPAYNAIPFLGISKGYEKDIIRHLEPAMASVMTDYGFDLEKGEPRSSAWLTYYKEMLPKSVYNRFYFSRKKKTHFLEDFENKFSFAPELTNLVKDLQLPLRLERLSQNAFLAPLIPATGYFIRKSV